LKKIASLLITLALVITMFAGISTSVNAVVIDANYEIKLHSVVYDPTTNMQNWTYNVTCISSHGISHIIFELKDICDPPLSAVVDAGPTTVGTGTDGSTGVYGIKFEDFITGNGSIEPGEWNLVWFVLEGYWDETGEIEVYVKAGGFRGSGWVEGPDCIPDHVVPEVPFGSIMAVAAMLGAFVAYSVLRKRKSS
jgi:hypothetical protein